MAEPGLITVTWALGQGPRHVVQRREQVPLGTTVGQLIQLHRQGDPASPPALSADQTVAVWGRVRAEGWVLCDGDRLEVLRPLTVDPMEARRRRQQHQQLAKSKPTRKLVNAKSTNKDE